MKYSSLAVIAALMAVVYMAVMNPALSTTAQDTKSNSKKTGVKTMTVELKTNHGSIFIELNPEKAPITVENFLQYVNDGFFNGTIFHRVIPGFMIQGGGFVPGMDQKETRAQIKNEADNGLKNDIGTVAMARTPDPDSASSQFFINLKDNDFLNYSAPTPQGWGYCVFGKVTGGMDVVQAIEKVNTSSSGHHQDVPTDDVIIESASQVIEEAEAGEETKPSEEAKTGEETKADEETKAEDETATKTE